MANQLHAFPTWSILVVSSLVMEELHAKFNTQINVALNEFSNLQRIWSHCKIWIQRKVALFNFLILSKLLYGLDGVQLNQCEKNRLDAFHCKYLRRISKVPHSYCSHVSNDHVLQVTNAQSLTHTHTQVLHQTAHTRELHNTNNYGAKEAFSSRSGGAARWLRGGSSTKKARSPFDPGLPRPKFIKWITIYMRPNSFWCSSRWYHSLRCAIKGSSEIQDTCSTIMKFMKIWLV